MHNARQKRVDILHPDPNNKLPVNQAVCFYLQIYYADFLLVTASVLLPMVAQLCGGPAAVSV
jgi:hypothetical protein